MTDSEAIGIRRKVLMRMMYHVKALGDTPMFGFVSFANVRAIEQVAEIKEPEIARTMVGGVVFSGMNLGDDGVILVTKYKFPL